jgi:hypothetical protein
MLEKKTVAILHGLKLKSMEQLRDGLTMASGCKFRGTKV